MTLHNQMNRTIHSHEMSVVDAVCFSDKLKEHAALQQNPKMALLFKKVAEWESIAENLRSDLNSSLSRDVCDPLLASYSNLRKHSKLYDKAKSAFEAADVRLKQYNTRGAKLNLVRHVELEQEVDQRSRELLQRVQELSLLKEEFDKQCMDRFLGYLESWHQFFTTGEKLVSELAPFIERIRFETAQFGKDLEAYQKVKQRDSNPRGVDDTAQTVAPQIGVVDDDYIFAIKNSALGSASTSPTSPSLLSPASSPTALTPVSSPRGKDDISHSVTGSASGPIPIDSNQAVSSPSSNSPIPASPDPKEKPERDKSSRGSVVRLTDWDSTGTTAAALVKSQKRLSVRFYRLTLTGSPALTGGPSSPPGSRKILSDDEDEDDWEEGPWEMRHSVSKLFGDIPNVFDIRKVNRVGKGRSFTIIVNVEVNNFVLKRKGGGGGGKETIRMATSLLQIIRSRKRDRRVRMIWFLPGGEDGKGGNDVFEESYFLASKLHRERFYEVASWAPIVGSMNEVDGKRVFLTTEELSVFIGSWNVGTNGLNTARVPESLHSFIPKTGIPNDIIVIGLQDCGTDAWFDAVQQHLGTTYIKLTTKTAGHLRMGIFILRKHFHKISYYQAIASTKAIVLSLVFNETSLCFMNCRFPSSDSADARNRVWKSIVKDIPLKNNHIDITQQFHHQFIFGDFGYRLEGNKEVVSELVAKKDWKTLAAHDELTKERKEGNCFVGYEEAPIAFSPTKSSNHEAIWSDRVLWRSLPGLTGHFAPTSYLSNENETTFEHFPINATFNINTILPNMPHQEIPCQISITRLYLTTNITKASDGKSALSTPNYFVEFFNPDFIERSVCSPMLSRVILDKTSNRQIILGNKDDKTVISPFTTNKQYLINQHLYLAVISSDSPQAAQAVVSLREACSTEGITKFAVQFSLNNRNIGTLSGKLSLTYQDGGGDVASQEGPATVPPLASQKSWLREGETNLGNLMKILTNPGARRVFEEFMKSQMAEENVDFWVAVHNRKQQEDKEKLSADANAIFKKFISGNGMYEINIESDLKKALQDKLEADPSDPKLFDEAEFNILREISENSLRRFLQSEHGNSLEVIHALFFE